MGDFRKPHGNNRFGKKSFGDRPTFGKKPGFGRRDDRDSGNRKLYTATCATCGKPCEVPFRPEPGRPIYCREHFGGPKASVPMPTTQFPRNDFRPRDDRPIASPVRPAAPADDKRLDAIKQELDRINAKLERIVEMIATPKVPETAPKISSPKKPAAPKKKNAKKK